MSSTYTDRIDGAATSLAIKAPVKVATTENITLSGVQTIDGVSAYDGDRVLVKNQDLREENGIYCCKANAWTREPDFDGARDVARGTIVFVTAGTANGRKFFRLTNIDPVIGVSPLYFVPVLGLENSQNTLSHASRADLIAYIQEAPAEADGTLHKVGSLEWCRRAAANDISDMPGYEPVGGFLHVGHFPTEDEAFAYAASRNLMVETTEPNRFRGALLTAGFNNKQNDAWVSYATQIDNSEGKRLSEDFTRVADAASGDPGAGNWSTNSLRTVLRFSDTAVGGDASADLKNIFAGQTVRLEQDATVYAVFLIGADAVDMGAYYELPDVTLTETGAGGFPEEGQISALTGRGPQRSMGLASHIAVNDPGANGDHTAFFARAVTNVNATGRVRCSAIAGYHSAVIRGPEPDGTLVKDGEVWASYHGATFNQSNGLFDAAGVFDRAANATSGNPGAGNWATRLDRSSLRISYSDGAADDRESELRAIRKKHIIRFELTSDSDVSMEWRINALGTDHGTYIQFDDVTYRGDGVGGAVPLDATTNIAGDKLYNEALATDGKLVAQEVKVGNWGGSDYDPFDPVDAAGQNRVKVGTWYAAGGDADNAYSNPVSMAIWNGNDKIGFNYFAGFRNVRKSYLRFVQPLGDNGGVGVRGLQMDPAVSGDGVWARSAIVMPNGSGLGWWNTAGDAIEWGIVRDALAIEIKAPARFLGDGNINIDWRSTADASTGIFATHSFDAKNDAGQNTQYVQMQANARTVTDGAEDGRWQLDTMVGGVLTTEIDVSGGVALGAAAGGRKGVGTLNALRLYEGGKPASMTRAEAIAYLGTSPSHADGTRFVIDNLEYKWKTAATDIGDLPNLVPAVFITSWHFGVAQDAGIDDTDRINEFLAYCEGRTGFFAPGTYRCNGSLIPKSNSTIRGVSGATILHQRGDKLFAPAEDLERFHLSGIVMDFKKPSGVTAFDAALAFKSHSECILEDLEFIRYNDVTIIERRPQAATINTIDNTYRNWEINACKALSVSFGQDGYQFSADGDGVTAVFDTGVVWPEESIGAVTVLQEDSDRKFSELARTADYNVSFSAGVLTVTFTAAPAVNTRIHVYTSAARTDGNRRPISNNHWDKIHVNYLFTRGPQDIRWVDAETYSQCRWLLSSDGAKGYVGNPYNDRTGQGGDYTAFQDCIVSYQTDFVTDITSLVGFDFGPGCFAMSGRGVRADRVWVSGSTNYLVKENDGRRRQLTGTVSGTTGTAIVTGVGTKFQSELTLVGDTPDIFEIGGNLFAISSIDSDTQITLTTNLGATYSGETAYRVHKSSGVDYVMNITSMGDGFLSTRSNQVGEVTYNSTTKRSGAATILAGDTFVEVEHGLRRAPVPGEIMVTAHSVIGDRSFSVSALGSTTFRININLSSVLDYNFGWKAELMELN